MFKRDFLQGEIQKLAEVLAKIIQYKRDEKFEESDELSRDTVSENFGLAWDDLVALPTDQFEKLVREKSFDPAKLDLLGQLLFESVHPFEEVEETDRILHKVLFIFRITEEEHHIQSFDNLSRRQSIDNYLNNRQYE